MVRDNARRAAVISSPDLGVFAVAAEGVLCSFGCLVDGYLNSVSAANPVQTPLSLLFLELNNYYGSAARIHCLRRRRPGQARRRQGGLQITADRRGYWRALEPSLVRTELADRDLRARSATRTQVADDRTERADL